MFQLREAAEKRLLKNRSTRRKHSSSSSTHVDETDTMPSFSSDVSEAIPVCIVTKNDTLSFK